MESDSSGCVFGVYVVWICNSQDIAVKEGESKGLNDKAKVLRTRIDGSLGKHAQSRHLRAPDAGQNDVACTRVPARAARRVEKSSLSWYSMRYVNLVAFWRIFAVMEKLRRPFCHLDKIPPIPSPTHNMFPPKRMLSKERYTLNM